MLKNKMSHHSYCDRHAHPPAHRVGLRENRRVAAHDVPAPVITRWVAAFVLLLPLAGCGPALAPKLEAATQASYSELKGSPENRLVAFSALPRPRSLNGEVAFSRRGGELLVSNDPEYLGDATILPTALYRDEFVGSFRVFYHHANSTRADLTLATAVTNTQAAPLLLFTRGLGGDTNVYPDVAGQKALDRYLGTRHRTIHLAKLAPGESILVAPRVAGPGDTASALEEYVALTPPPEAAKHALPLALVEALRTPSPGRDVAGGRWPELPSGFSLATVTVTVVAYERAPPAKPQSLPVVPAGPSKPLKGTPYHLLSRGTFPFSDRHTEIALAPGPTVLTLNSAVSGPFSRALPGEYLPGADAVSGRKGFNNGNYGVLYDLRLCISTDAPLGFPYGFLMQPAGGAGHYALQVEGETVRSPFVSYRSGWWFYRVLAFGPKVCTSLRANLTGGSFGPQKFFFVPFPLFEEWGAR